MSVPSNVFYAFLASKLEAGGSETTISLDRVTTRTGETITTSDFDTFGRGILTVNPDGDGKSSYPEYISFTAVSGNTLTGAIRGLSAKSDTVVVANKRFHPSGTPVVLSFGAHNIQDLIDYVDDGIAVVTVGTANAVTATAGETISSAPAVVYLKSDGKWWLTDADTTTTIENVQLGVALSAVAAEASITNGVVRKGLVSGFSGLVAGTTYYISNTAGEISSSAGTNSKRIGIAKSSTELYFDPEYYELPTGAEKAALVGINNSPSSTNPFVTTDDLSDSTVKPPQVVTFTSSGTWTKDAGLKYVVVEVSGGGGGGGGAKDNTTGATGGGGGGGGYSRKLILAASLGATETVTIGSAGSAGGATPTNGGSGGTTSFGSQLQATGGAGGTAEGAGGAGGAGSSGDLNLSGQSGGGGLGVSGYYSGAGGSSILGLGGASITADATGQAGKNYGGGGSGGRNINDSGQAGGAGAAGVVIVTEYYS